MVCESPRASLTLGSPMASMETLATTSTRARHIDTSTRRRWRGVKSGVGGASGRARSIVVAMVVGPLGGARAARGVRHAGGRPRRGAQAGVGGGGSGITMPDAQTKVNVTDKDCFGNVGS